MVLREVQDLEHARPARLARHRIRVEARHLVPIGDRLQETLQPGDELIAGLGQPGAVDRLPQLPIALDGLG